MGIINRVATGFLDLIDSQTQGRTPPAFVDAVQPTVELGELYAADSLGGLQFSQNHTAPITVAFIVPQDEMWLLRTVGVQLNSFPALNAFEIWQVRVGRTPRVSSEGNVPDPTIDIWTSKTLTSLVVGQGDADALVLPVPITMKSGQSLLFTLTQRDATALRTTACSVLMTILKL
ncbi:MAG: hypothetical protein GY949_18250 [Gammaproteobacteria bacterium]|nr:hypothetical protein [Gammaproteobacteria bacterium]